MNNQKTSIQAETTASHGIQLSAFRQGALWTILLTATTLAFFSSCKNQKAKSPASSEEPIAIRLLDFQEINERIQSQQGKVVVVDIWATDCPPCIEKLPKLAKLQEQFGQKLHCMTVSLDYVGLPDRPASSYTKSVEDILKAVGAQKLDHVIATEESDIMLEKFDVNAPPAVQIYDTNGQMVFPGPDDDPAIDHEALDIRIADLVSN